MHRLYDQWAGPDIEFLFVYCREPHPGRVYPQPAAYEERVAQARTFAEKYGSPLHILVDAMDSPVQRAYGDLPNMAYVISKRGLMVYKASWTKPDEIGALLRNLREAEQARAQSKQVFSVYTEKIEYNSPEWEARRLAETRRVLVEAGSPDLKLFGLEPGEQGAAAPAGDQRT
ncbi:MAG: hypothetical protein HY330_05415 [Chloroflexi bacterium]|nr:hypothetical protein [Chloroflexota bacterium]